jgi:hypothetical protein
VAYGGAVENDEGTFRVNNSVFVANRARGGDGQLLGGSATGGAFANIEGGIVAMTDVLFSDNRAQGGAGAASGGIGAGGALACGLFKNDGAFGPSIATLNNVIVSDNQAQGGPHAAGLGGGLFVGPAGTLTLTNSQVKKNHADGQPGIGGGVYSLGTFSFDAATDVSNNHASTSNNDIFS